ncbi:uncharacterized protein LOC135941298 [Cloeon dipterum]|uniref:uncharacterized protein LOC135941298 n=1 Tax=Cloeon dipterum TaxID=197152 RepID=UPI00321F9F88
MRRHRGDKRWLSKSRWDSRESSQNRNNNYRGKHRRGTSLSSRTIETTSDRENQDKHRESHGEHLDGQRNDEWEPPAPPSYPAANISVNGNQPYMPLPYFMQPSMYYQGLQHQMWSTYCQLASYHQTAGTSSGPNQRPSLLPFPPPHFHGNFQQLFTNRPPSLLSLPFQPPPGVRQCNGPQEDGSEKSETSDKTRKEKEEEPPPPGSEAAREKERAEIARRLQDFDKNPVAPSGEKEKSLPKEKSKPAATSQPSAKKPVGAPGKARPKDNKAPDKTLKRPATSSSSEVSKKKKKANELNEDIAKQISAMGVNEIKTLVNNPHSVKSQEILNALMKHYRELKTVELDKRRLLAPTSVDNSASFDANSIGISDLPPEIISQLEKILGFNIFQSAEQVQADDEVRIVSPDPQQSNNDQVANGDQETENCQRSEPVQILEELVFIDLRIQSDISRKMELYQRLHEIVTGSQQTRVDDTADSTSFPPVIHLGSPLQSSSGKNKSQSPEKEIIAIPSTSNPLPAKGKNDMQKKGSNPGPAKKSVKSSNGSKSTFSNYNKPPPILNNKVSFDIRSLNTEIYDMKVADSSVVLVACSNKVIYGFDLKTAKKTHELKGHVDVVTCLKHVKYYRGSVEEHVICSGGLDEQLCIFGFKSQQCVTKHYVASPILCLEFFHDHVNKAQILYAGLKNGSIYIYDVEKFIPKGTLDCGEKAILALLASKEGSLNVLLVASEDKTICLRDASTGLYLRQFSYSYVATNFVAYEDAFFCQSVSNGVTYFNIKTGAYLGFLKANCSVSKIAKYRNLLLVTLCSGAIRVYDMHTKTLVTEISGGGKLLRFIDVASENIVAAARVNDMFAMPFTPEMKAALDQ